MPPKSAPSSVDVFAEFDHFYRLRDVLRSYIPARLADPPNHPALALAQNNLLDAIRLHCAAFPEDEKDHEGLGALIVTLSYFWLKDGNKGTKPSWFRADSTLLVRVFLFSFISLIYSCLPAPRARSFLRGPRTNFASSDPPD